MRSAPRGALIAALVVAVVLLLGSVGATIAWAGSGSSPFGVLRYDDGGWTGGDEGWYPGGHRMAPGWRELPGNPRPAPASPSKPRRPAPSRTPAEPGPTSPNR
jgi:hypothetical protein